MLVSRITSPYPGANHVAPPVHPPPRMRRSTARFFCCWMEHFVTTRRLRTQTSMVDALHIDAFDGVRKAKRIGDASVKLTAWPIGTLKSTGRGRWV